MSWFFLRSNYFRFYSFYFTTLNLFWAIRTNSWRMDRSMKSWAILS